MSKEEAIKLLQQVCDAAMCSKMDHDKLDEALKVLAQPAVEVLPAQ